MPWVSLLPDLCGRVVSGKCGPTLWESTGREGEGSILHLGGGASWGLCAAVARRAGGLRRVWISSRRDFVQPQVDLDRFIFHFLKGDC